MEALKHSKWRRVTRIFARVDIILSMLSIVALTLLGVGVVFMTVRYENWRTRLLLQTEDGKTLSVMQATWSRFMLVFLIALSSLKIVAAIKFLKATDLESNNLAQLHRCSCNLKSVLILFGTLVFFALVGSIVESNTCGIIYWTIFWIYRLMSIFGICKFCAKVETALEEESHQNVEEAKL